MGSANSSGGKDTQHGALRLAGVFTDRDHLPSNDEIEWFRDTLARYENRERFWRDLLTELTPAGLLELNGNLALLIPNPPPGGRFADPELAEVLGDIQTLLGGGLATVCTCKGLQMPWLVGLTQAGRRRYELVASRANPPAPVQLYGYQLLGPLLQHGAYDDRFLKIVGGDIVHFELTHGGGRCWLDQLGADVHSVRLDWTGGAAPTDPVGLDPLLGLVSAIDRHSSGVLDLMASVAVSRMGLREPFPSSHEARGPSHP